MSAKIRRLTAFGLTTRHADALGDFYEKALGAHIRGSDRLAGDDFQRLMNVEGGARRLSLTMGSELIELLEFDRPGDPYPAAVSPVDVTFQHFALVVSDIQQALQRLSQTTGWRSISPHGPQRLPQRSGGVTAYKFRDPDGHPLEFLEFPRATIPEQWAARKAEPGIWGIDHSAISVCDTARSIDFYRDLGLTVGSQSLNHGPTQEDLDGIPHARVMVTALAPSCATPHVELLCYESASSRGHAPPRSNDVAATRLILEIERTTNQGCPTEALVTDPDGHRLQLR